MSWTLKWLMLFNVLKCVVLNISLKRKTLTHPPLTLNGFELEQVSSHRHLGLVFNSSFTWNDHIEHLCQKAGKLINMMKYLKYILPREALEKIYISRIRSMIEYGNVLYDNCPKYLSDRLESVQLDAARVCTGALPQSNCQKTLSEIGWETLQTRRKWHKLIHMYKIVNQLVPDYLHSHCPDLDHAPVLTTLDSQTVYDSLYVGHLPLKNHFFHLPHVTGME